MGQQYLQDGSLLIIIGPADGGNLMEPGNRSSISEGDAKGQGQLAFREEISYPLPQQIGRWLPLPKLRPALGLL